MVLAGGCAQQATREHGRPDWVDGVSARYPNNAWLTGRGQADSAAVARDRARADLAKIFAVDVHEQTSDTTRYQATGSGDEQNASLESKLSRDLSTRTDQVVRGVQIADAWEDPATHVHYALAVLSRARAGQMLRGQIAELDDATRGDITDARRADDLFQRIAAASRAVALQRERAALQKSLQAVDVTGRGVPPQWTVEKLLADRDQLLARVEVTPQAEGPQAKTLQPLLSAAVSRAGFTIKPAAPYVLTGTLAYDELPPRNGWYWIKGSLQLVLADGQGQARGAMRFDLKTSGTAQALARQRLVDRVADLLDNRLRDALVDMATGKSGKGSQ
jgi:hypothetical protein